MSPALPAEAIVAALDADDAARAEVLLARFDADVREGFASGRYGTADARALLVEQETLAATIRVRRDAALRALDKASRHRRGAHAYRDAGT